MAAAGAACLVLALAWSAGLPVAALAAMAILCLALPAWKSQAGARALEQLSLADGVCRVQRAGAWETAASWTMVRAGASCLRLHLTGVRGLRDVSVWRDAVPHPIWRSLCLLAVREREHPGSLRRPGGTA